MPRPDITMQPKQWREFLEKEQTAVLASMGVSGFPHLVAMWYIVTDQGLLMWTYTKSQKVRNLERDARVSALVEAGERYDELRGVLIRGQAELDRDFDHVLSLGMALHQRYTGAQTGTSLAAAEPGIRAQAAKRVLIRLPYTHVTSWDHRKLGDRQ